MRHKDPITRRTYNYIRMVAACLLCLALCCCEKKENAVYELLTFRTEIKNNCDKYTADDWENALNKYSDICQRVDQMPLTSDERMEVEKIKGEIAGYAASVAAQEISNNVKTISSEIESFATGFSKTFKQPE